MTDYRPFDNRQFGTLLHDILYLAALLASAGSCPPRGRESFAIVHGRGPGKIESGMQRRIAC